MNEMNFSQRMGYIQKKSLQIESIDDELRTSLWNIFYLFFRDGNITYVHDSEYDQIYEVIYMDFFKRPVDEMSSNVDSLFSKFKQYYFDLNWHKVYDFLEFIIQRFSSVEGIKSSFYIKCNKVLEKEMSGYRFIGNRISPITNKDEIDEIENALSNTKKRGLDGANEHLIAAQKLFSDRKSPDFRNSIKESISAVEGLVNIITNNQKGTLGKALKNIEKEIAIHSALKEGFQKLYGYTSDENGIRHAMMEKSDCDFVDAKYMLVSCSAFVNYLIGKADKAGIKLQ